MLRAAEAAGATASEAGREAALRAACAVELIHAYSLVHDDMPCMDNDVLRRGKPTVHVAFGEAQAMLAGDAMQALAFEVLADEETHPDPFVRVELVKALAMCSGPAGMAGGQAIDLASVGHHIDAVQLKRMHDLKTGALLEASVNLGSSCGQASPESLTSLAEYGQALGVAFQVIDDVLDVTADAATLGKTAGKDAAHDKPTYVSLLGLEASQRHAHELLDQALQALQRSGLSNTQLLADLAQQVVARHH